MVFRIELAFIVLQDHHTAKTADSMAVCHEQVHNPHVGSNVWYGSSLSEVQIDEMLSEKP